MARAFEVHEHRFISGPRARGSAWPRSTLVHSHFGGEAPHKHPDTGPSSYTIDKDEWFRVTGLKGGGRKQFTPAPSGEQLPVIRPSAEESSFEIHVMDPPPGFVGSGGGMTTAARMVLGHRLKAVVIDGGGEK